jgi:hypothetical protein
LSSIWNTGKFCILVDGDDEEDYTTDVVKFTASTLWYIGIPVKQNDIVFIANSMVEKNWHSITKDKPVT